MYQLFLSLRLFILDKLGLLSQWWPCLQKYAWPMFFFYDILGLLSQWWLCFQNYVTNVLFLGNIVPTITIVTIFTILFLYWQEIGPIITMIFPAAQNLAQKLWNLKISQPCADWAYDSSLSASKYSNFLLTGYNFSPR